MKKIYLIVIFSLLTFYGCGGSEEQQIQKVILDAHIAIDAGECQDAITALEDYGREMEHGAYVRALASSYACAAGYSTLALFEDMQYFGIPSVIGGLTRFSNSSVTVNPDIDDSYQYLQKAIDVLLFSGGISGSAEPSADSRAEVFSLRESQDINSLLFYLILEQLGKYSSYYGNVGIDTAADPDVPGVKGKGIAGNKCYLDYDGAGISFEYDIDGDDVLETITLSNYLAAGLLGDCDAGGKGHADMGIHTAVTEVQVKRICQGVILMNTFLDTLDGVITGVGGEMTTVAGEQSAIDLAKVAIETLAPGTTVYMNQINCESNFATDTDNLQIYFAFLYDLLFQ